MRTTIVIEDDVLDRARSASRKLKVPFRRVVNEALRAGLESLESAAEARPYRTEPHAMGLRAGLSLDNIQNLLAQLDGEDQR
ncbi:MAG: DUF2191 domain-containing protein [Verrucomicrobia bacterium]|nr:DUF2191 domain-containing protein [Verrucomicrobiota bacterium]